MGSLPATTPTDATAGAEAPARATGPAAATRGGQTGTKIAVRAIAVDPGQPQRIYAAAAAGLFRSDDAGQSWQPAGQGIPAGSVEALALDTRQPERLHAIASAGGLYVSEDGAGSWRAARGASLPGAAARGGR